MAELLSVQNVETLYGPIMALRGVSMQVREGQILALLGANGAGKSTLLKTISGTMVPKKGRVEFQGRSIEGTPPHQIARLGIAQVPEGREVFALLTTEQNLHMGGYVRGRADIAESLRRVYALFPALYVKRASQAGYLSGGQQQMLAIGRAMMSSPRLMLLDEPSLGLSPQLVSEIAETIVKLNREQGVTIMLVEQNARMALDVADYGYVLENGRIVMENTAKNLSDATDIKEFYLGMKEQGVRGRRRWKQRKTWR